MAAVVMKTADIDCVGGVVGETAIGEDHAKRWETGGVGSNGAAESWAPHQTGGCGIKWATASSLVDGMV